MTSMLSQNAVAAGHSSDVTVTAIINDDGIIAHLLVDASGETEGQKVMDPAYLTQFLGKTLPLTLGEDVDAVSGATATCQAVVDALNLLDTQYDNTHDEKTVVNQRSVVSETIYTLAGPGHDGTVKVVVKLDPNGVITSLRIDASGESNGADVMESAFRNQFIGKTLPLTLGAGVDAVSGATATSQAVVDILNRLAE
ncbi:MAG: FMN-binding protein [Clostridia bacterium]|nr:FMN-binding protein [Clostridia bacterium]